MSSLRPVAHVVSHTHWDREWYQSFEFFRYRLVELMDRLLDGMAADPGYRAFHLDGQTIILEDYLQIHPERAEQVREMIRTGRLRIGPFYVLQDEFLVSGEANLRSLLHGHIDCERWGAIEKVGYLPDNFGNCSQMPQLLQGFGIDSAVFGRGVEPFRADPEGGKSGAGHKAELIWRGADGSELFTVLMTRWYNNGMNLVFQTPEEVDSALAETASTATASDILVMHGCDHQPVNL
ncbi:MAG TPA: alpha-mannosidase, partial [Verrucomicrobia bacterium]|nr:alpha-mannosidase [Verrucomicrobiota bacterium]